MTAYRWSAPSRSLPTAEIQPPPATSSSSTCSHPPVCVFRHHANHIIYHLEKTTANTKRMGGSGVPDFQVALTEQRHERCMPGQNPDLAVEGRRNYALRLALKYRTLGGDDCDVHHAASSFFARSTTSSMPPCM